MTDEDPPTEPAAPAEPAIPTKIPPQDDTPFSAYRAFGEIRPLPPEEHSHWDVDSWHRGQRGAW